MPLTGRLTTHVLDIITGRPAAGVRIILARLDGAKATILLETRTNADGRCDAPLLGGEAMQPGRYELLFHAGDYFRASLTPLADPPFLDEIPIRFGIASASQHYHVPLLVSPWAYSTYRGS